MQRNLNLKNRMREIRSSGSVGEPVGNHRLDPAGWAARGARTDHTT